MVCAKFNIWYNRFYGLSAEDFNEVDLQLNARFADKQVLKKRFVKWSFIDQANTSKM